MWGNYRSTEVPNTEVEVTLKSTTSVLRETSTLISLLPKFTSVLRETSPLISLGLQQTQVALAVPLVPPDTPPTLPELLLDLLVGLGIPPEVLLHLSYFAVVNVPCKEDS